MQYPVPSSYVAFGSGACICPGSEEQEIPLSLEADATCHQLCLPFSLFSLITTRLVASMYICRKCLHSFLRCSDNNKAAFRHSLRKSGIQMTLALLGAPRNTPFSFARFWTQEHITHISDDIKVGPPSMICQQNLPPLDTLLCRLK